MTYDPTLIQYAAVARQHEYLAEAARQRQAGSGGGVRAALSNLRAAVRLPSRATTVRAGGPLRSAASR